MHYWSDCLIFKVRNKREGEIIYGLALQQHSHNFYVTECVGMCETNLHFFYVQPHG